MPVRHFPRRDRLSVLTATVVLAYILARIIELPVRFVGGTFLGSALGFEVNSQFLMLLLVAALVSTGTDPLIRSHPRFGNEPHRLGTLTHWILPGALALVLGAALNSTAAARIAGLIWWLELAAGALALIGVLTAEYIVVDAEDPSRDAASLALKAIAYALALILFDLLHLLGARAAISSTVGGLFAAGIAGRLFALNRTEARRAVLYAALVGLMCAETIWLLSYWRVNSIGAALVIMQPFYLGTGIAQQNLAGGLTRRVWVEFGVVGIIGLAICLAYVLQGA